jgi:hypothetical protein
MVRDVQARHRFEAQMLALGPLAGELFEVCCMGAVPGCLERHGRPVCWRSSPQGRAAAAG